MRILILTFALLLLLFSLLGEQGLTYRPKRAEVKELNERLAGTSGRFHDTSYQAFMQSYKPFGDYLNWGEWRDFKNDGEIVMHESGLPQVQDGEKLYWNTVALSHYALTMYGRYLRGDNTAQQMFFAAADKLLDLQREDGGFPYPSRQHRHTTLKDGWVSAMAQGNALSVFARALQLKEEPRYRKAGEIAMRNLLTPVAQGGSFTTMADLDASMSDYVFFPEYPNTPIDYTLNGYMFALLGIYDWSNVKSANQQEAVNAFHDGMSTLDRILPLFDIDGFSAYDLAHIVLKLPPYVAAEYLGIHVYLLHALNSIAPSKVLTHYERKWQAKVDEMNRTLKFTKIILSEPAGKVGQSLLVDLDAGGGTDAQKLYKMEVRLDGVWTPVSDYGDSSKLTWTPRMAGSYVLGFFIKNADSKQEFDNFRYQAFEVD